MRSAAGSPSHRSAGMLDIIFVPWRLPLLGSAARTRMNENILLVEDEEALRIVLSDCFRREGYVVDSAPDGMLGFVKATSLPFDLIILDIMLPGRNGLDAMALTFVVTFELLGSVLPSSCSRLAAKPRTRVSVSNSGRTTP